MKKQLAISYREICSDDNEVIAQVIRSILEEFGVNKPGTVYTDPTTDKLYELFQREGAQYELALVDNKVVGACGIFPTDGLPDGCAELVKFYLLADYRGLGIGKRLMLNSIAFSKSQGYKQLYIESLPELDVAVGMYEKFGFKHIPKRLGKSGHFACSILMLKEL